MFPINDFGRWWLSGPKYDLSARLAGPAWTVSVEEALNRRGRTLAHARSLEEVLQVFRGREFWKQDGFYQLQDVVLPPEMLLAAAGDDCDGWAMTHCQAINHALGGHGWRAYIVSYLADPWWVSHHYCVARAPLTGQFWAVQPQPSQGQWQQHGEASQSVFGPYPTIEASVAAVAAMYNARAVWWDRRDGMYLEA